MSNTRTPTPLRVALAAALVATLSGPGAAAAQVGHPPQSSPYRDLRAKYMLSLTGGYAGGSGGKVEVGPSNGPLGGVRLDLALSGPGAIQLGLMVGNLERRIYDTDEGPANRDLGKVTQAIIFADVGADLVLTGQKTWHGLAPYVGATLGMALGGDVPEDSTGFRFSTQFMVGPHAGFRWHPTDRVFLRVEGRDMIWQLRYPTTFFSEPANAPGEAPLLDPATNKNTQWTHTPMLFVSLGFSIFR